MGMLTTPVRRLIWLGGHVAALEDAAMSRISAPDLVHAQVAALFGHLRGHDQRAPRIHPSEDGAAIVAVAQAREGRAGALVLPLRQADKGCARCGT